MRKLLALLALALLGMPAVANAQPSCGDVITQSTVLTADLHCTGAGLTVAGEGITLDLNGYTIYGSGLKSGIAVGLSDATIVNGRITGFERGISGSRSTIRIRRIRTVRNTVGILLERGVFDLRNVAANRNAELGISIGVASTVTARNVRARRNGDPRQCVGIPCN
jgi:hypothetical protein